MKTLLALFLAATASFAQSVTIKANSLTLTGTASGAVSGTITVTGPAADITLPVTGLTAGLPAGLTYSATAGLAVTGPITASGLVTGYGLADTAGPSVPACTRGLYVFQYTAATNTLTPFCLPAITVTATQ